MRENTPHGKSEVFNRSLNRIQGIIKNIKYQLKSLKQCDPRSEPDKTTDFCQILEELIENYNFIRKNEIWWEHLAEIEQHIGTLEQIITARDFKKEVDPYDEGSKSNKEGYLVISRRTRNELDKILKEMGSIRRDRILGENRDT